MELPDREAWASQRFFTIPSFGNLVAEVGRLKNPPGSELAL
jgi:hypothetical protein